MAQSNYLNPLKKKKNLWNDLRRAVHRRSSCNFTHLEHVCKEEWNEIAKAWYAKLLNSYPKRLSTVLQANGASTKTYLRRIYSYASVLLYFFFFFLLFAIHLNLDDCCITSKVEKYLTELIVVSFFTLQKPAIFTGVCRLSLSTVCVWFSQLLSFYLETLVLLVLDEIHTVFSHYIPSFWLVLGCSAYDLGLTPVYNVSSWCFVILLWCTAKADA